MNEAPNLDELVENYSMQEIVDYLYNYNDWITKQLSNGGLIFSPEDYFGIWQGQV